MTPGTDLRHRRLIVPLRWFAKQSLVQWDVFRCRRDPSVRRWLPMLRGSHAGHVVVPSRAVASSRSETQNFIQRGMVRPGDSVLDIGAGNGRQAIGLLEVGVLQYTGLEVIRASVEHANRAFATFDTVHFDFFDVANAMYNPSGQTLPEDAVFPYSNESFDFVVAGSLYTHLEHLGVAAHYVDETARVLRPGGTAYMSWFRDPPNTITNSATRTVFAEADIRGTIERHFDIVDEAGGDNTDWHNQWQLYLRKRQSPAS